MLYLKKKPEEKMKATIFDIQRFSVHDGLGIRTTVFMKGCSLRCAWCHNPEGLAKEITPRFFASECIRCGACGGEHTLERVHLCPTEALRPSGREIELDELIDELLRDRPFYAEDGGVTFSGGECLLQPDFVAAAAARLHGEGISTAIDTAGFVPWTNIEKTLPSCDLYLYDVKCADPVLHKRYTGADNSLILENLRRLDKAGARLWIRIPVIPDFNDSDSEISAIADTVAQLGSVERVTLMPYHTLGKSKYETLGMTPPYDTDRAVAKSALEAFRKIIETKGLKVE